jgi:hypothetical protein
MGAFGYGYDEKDRREYEQRDRKASRVTSIFVDILVATTAG